MLSKGNGLETVQVLWCPDSRYNRRLGWRFPRQVDALLKELTAGASTLQLFGGLATWGVRLDIDPGARPDVLGDAYLPPFKRDSFDCVIIDPPYEHVPGPAKASLFRQAGWIARHRVYWFHTHWPASNSPLVYSRGWLIRTGRSMACRCLVEFTVRESKGKPAPLFARGPRKLHRWPSLDQVSLGL